MISWENIHKSDWPSSLLVFLCAFFLFTYFHFNATFADVDSFYHAKMAALLKERGVIRDFVWANTSILKDYFTDQYFLYHASLIPFVTFFDPLVGVKIATVVFASFAVLFFYWLLKKFKVRYPLFFIFVLLLPNAFLYRLNLAKAQALSFIALFVFLYLVFEKKYVWLFALSFIFVALHGSFPLVLVLGLIYSIVFREVKILGVLFAGVSAGLVVNPYFPKNFIFYWHQIVHVAIINYQDLIDVGSEWYPYGFFEFIHNANLPLFLFLASCAYAFLQAKEFPRSWKFFSLSALLFLVLSFKSRRNIEYFIPFAVLSSAYIFSSFMGKEKLFAFFRRQKILWPFVAVFFLALPFAAARGYSVIKRDFDNGFSFTYLKQPSEWLEQNTSAGDLVFTDRWDITAVLFYHNSHNRYLVMLDPTFMYNYDRETYNKYKSVTEGKQARMVYTIIKQGFGADYVLVTIPSGRAFDGVLRQDKGFEAVYSDAVARVYKVL